jgi:hypothetical protein
MHHTRWAPVERTSANPVSVRSEAGEKRAAEAAAVAAAGMGEEASPAASASLALRAIASCAETHSSQSRGAHLSISISLRLEARGVLLRCLPRHGLRPPHGIGVFILNNSGEVRR